MEINLHFDMLRNLLIQAYKFEQVTKNAGRIPVDKYIKQVFDIIKMIEAFMREHKHLSISPGDIKDLGSVEFNINGTIHKLPIKAILDRNVAFRAGFDEANGNPYLVINLYEFQYSNPNMSSFTNKLKPLIIHEVTHFLDSLYDPVNSMNVDKESPDVAFYEEFKDLFINNSVPENRKIDYSNIESFRGKTIDDLATKNVIQFVKTKTFKNLLAKYNKTMDRDLFGYLLKLIRTMYLEDVTTYRDTGGYVFGPPSDKKKREDMENVMNVGTTLYHRSDAEMKAYINQIIEEVFEHLRYNDNNVTILGLIRGKIKITEVIDNLLSKSPAFEQIKPYMTPENLKQIYKEVGLYLAKDTSRLNTNDWADKAGVTLSAYEGLAYRHLLKLYFNNPAKLTEKIKNPAFTEKYHKPLLVLKEYVDFEQSLKRVKDSMPKFDFSTSVSATPEKAAH